MMSPDAVETRRSPSTLSARTSPEAELTSQLFLQLSILISPEALRATRLSTEPSSMFARRRMRLTRPRSAPREQMSIEATEASRLVPAGALMRMLTVRPPKSRRSSRMTITRPTCSTTTNSAPDPVTSISTLPSGPG